MQAEAEAGESVTLMRALVIPNVDIWPEFSVRPLLRGLIGCAALFDPHHTCFELARAISSAGPPKKRGRQRKGQAAGFTVLPFKYISERETRDKFAGPNWERLVYSGEDRRQPAVTEWYRVNRCRIDDIREAWRAATEILLTWEVEWPEESQGLSELGRVLHERLPAEAAEVAACRRLLAERKLPCGFRLQGSLAELWSFQTGSDLDLVRCWPRDRSLSVVNLSPGLCQLRRPAAVERLGMRLGMLGLLARRFSTDSALTQMLSPGRFRRRLAKWRLADSRRRGLASRLQERGPAVTQEAEIDFGDDASRDNSPVRGAGDATHRLPSVDYVCSVRLNKWPRFLTAEWLPRHCRRHQFSPSGARVHVVPIGGTSTVPCTHAWRYSFHELEAAIARSLTPPEGACYALMKAAHRAYLKPAGYKSYHVKTGFLWLRHLEEPEVWQQQPGRLIRLALLGLTLVMQCGANGFMPNYFMPNENVMRQPLPAKPPATTAQLASFLTDAAGQPIIGVDRHRLAAWLDQLAAELAASAADLADATSAGIADCYCRVHTVTGRSLQSDCADCDKLMEWNRSAEQWQPAEDAAVKQKLANDGFLGQLSRLLGISSAADDGDGHVLGQAVFF